MSFNDKLIAARPALLSYARRVTRSKQEADDLVQETLCRCIKYASHFRGQAKVSTWAHAIMRRIRIDDLRRRDNETAGHVALRFARDHSAYHPEAIGRVLASKLETMPTSLRTPFQMHTEGYSHDEIAECMGLTRSAVSLRVHRARRHLRECLEAA
jgi:RNA polymerase sigma-70 factor (ECF subfamily)